MNSLGRVPVPSYIRVVRDGRIVVHHPGSTITVAEAVHCGLLDEGDVPVAELYPRPRNSQLPAGWA